MHVQNLMIYKHFTKFLEKIYKTSNKMSQNLFQNCPSRKLQLEKAKNKVAFAIYFELIFIIINYMSFQFYQLLMVVFNKQKFEIC